MFDIGGLELLLIAVVGLLVIGPERLPEALRSIGLQLGRLRRAFTSVKSEIEKEIGMDEVRRQLHNEAVMDEMKRIEKEVQSAKSALNESGLSETGLNMDEEMNIDPNAAMFDEARKEQDAQEALQQSQLAEPDSTQEAAQTETANEESSELSAEAQDAQDAQDAQRHADASDNQATQTTQGDLSGEPLNENPDAEHLDDGQPSDALQSKRLPPTEADLEAAWERKQRAQKQK